MFYWWLNISLSPFVSKLISKNVWKLFWANFFPDFFTTLFTTLSHYPPLIYYTTLRSYIEYGRQRTILERIKADGPGLKQTIVGSKQTIRGQSRRSFEPRQTIYGSRQVIRAKTDDFDGWKQMIFRVKENDLPWNKCVLAIILRTESGRFITLIVDLTVLLVT